MFFISARRSRSACGGRARRTPRARSAAGDGERTGLGLQEVRRPLVTAGVFWKRLRTLPPGATPGPDRRLLLGPQGGLRGSVASLHCVLTQVCSSVVGWRADGTTAGLSGRGLNRGRCVGTRQGSQSGAHVSNRAEKGRRVNGRRCDRDPLPVLSTFSPPVSRAVARQCLFRTGVRGGQAE